MNRNRIVFWIAIVLFIASFFVPAIHAPGFDGNLPGFLCAWLTLIWPWDSFLRGFAFDTVKSMAYFTFLLSGFINPLFIAAVVLLHTKQRRFGKLLRTVVISLFPVCCVALWKQHSYPVAGYFLWTANAGGIVYGFT